MVTFAAVAPSEIVKLMTRILQPACGAAMSACPVTIPSAPETSCNCMSFCPCENGKGPRCFAALSVQFVNLKLLDAADDANRSRMARLDVEAPDDAHGDFSVREERLVADGDFHPLRADALPEVHI